MFCLELIFFYLFHFISFIEKKKDFFCFIATPSIYIYIYIYIYISILFSCSKVDFFPCNVFYQASNIHTYIYKCVCGGCISIWMHHVDINFICSPSHHRKSMVQGLFLKWVRTQSRSPHASGKILKYLRILTKRMEKRLDDKYARILRVVLNKSWRQHPTKQQLYGCLPPITKTIKVRWTGHAEYCWRSKDKLISDIPLWTPFTWTIKGWKIS